MLSQHLRYLVINDLKILILVGLTIELFAYLTFTFPFQTSWVHVIWKTTVATYLIKGIDLDPDIIIAKVRSMIATPEYCITRCVF